MKRARFRYGALLVIRWRKVKGPVKLPCLVLARKLKLDMNIHTAWSTQGTVKSGELVCRREEKASFLSSDTIECVEQAAETDAARRAWWTAMSTRRKPSTVLT